MKKKVVVFGGGNGSMCTIQALKNCLDVFEISAAIAMSDSGGSQGRLRKEFNTVPTSDLMRAVLAMSAFDSHMLKKVFFKKKFTNAGKLDGHNLGNLFMMLSCNYGGSVMDTVKALSQAVEAVGKAFPCTLTNTNLVAEMQDGSTIVGEAEIDRPEQVGNNLIKKVRLEPPAVAYNEAVQSILDADHLIFGPGSLYCSIIASILPEGIFSAIEKSKARLIFIPGNKYEIHGEAGPTKLSEYIKVMESYLPRSLDLVIFNQNELTKNQKEFYEMKKWSIIEFDKNNLPDRKIIAADFEKENVGLDAIKLGEILRRHIVQDLEYAYV